MGEQLALEIRAKLAKFSKDELIEELIGALIRASQVTETLSSLANAEAIAGVRRIVAGWNGEGREGGPFQRHPDNLGATLPKTRCAAVYALDEALQEARRVLGVVGGSGHV